MTSMLTELGIDCADPESLAGFWCQVLDYTVLDAEPGLVTIGPKHAVSDMGRYDPVAPVLTFARVPEAKVVKNRLHFDVRPVGGDQAGEVQRLLALGARHATVGHEDQSWVVMADPEGNEFCVLAGLP